MKDKRHLFTSESVAVGHPDKICDQISDTVLDTLLRDDPEPEKARCACETMVTTGLVVVAGEITTRAYADIPQIVRDTVRDIGYNDPAAGFDYRSCGVITSIKEQSPDIAMGVNREDPDEQGAGDQGVMFGYACDETPELMPLPILMAHKLMERLKEVREQEEIDYLRPDGKCQVTVEYNQRKPIRVTTVVLSAHHKDGISRDRLEEDLKELVIKKVVPAKYLDKETAYKINPTGRFVKGGPHGDCGLTGRKIIVDTYGGVGSHGGGCFSGKDPSKVDRSASYMARYMAKNIVAGGLAKRCEVQIAYAIGVAQPVSILTDTQRTARCAPEKIDALIRDPDVFDLRPRKIIEYLDLIRPIYAKTACFGHFGRNDRDFTWEKTDKAEFLRKECGL